mgnify:CR=1 FL=1
MGFSQARALYVQPTDSEDVAALIGIFQATHEAFYLKNIAVQAGSE